ncbi:MAG: signal peptidase I [Culicoidibacterales bacterium]
MKRIFKIAATTLILAICTVVVAGFAGLLPIQFFNVLSGSMEPTIPTGSIVAIYKIDPNQLVVDDVVMFNPRQTSMVMHRVVAINETENGKEFITRGDANNTNDPIPIYSTEIVGKVFFFLPLIGALISWIKGNVIAFVIFLLVTMFAVQAGAKFIKHQWQAEQ